MGLLLPSLLLVALLALIPESFVGQRNDEEDELTQSSSPLGLQLANPKDFALTAGWFAGPDYGEEPEALPQGSDWDSVNASDPLRYAWKRSLLGDEAGKYANTLTHPVRS